MKAPRQVLNTIQMLLVIYIGPGSLVALHFQSGPWRPLLSTVGHYMRGRGLCPDLLGRAVSFFPYPVEASQQPHEEAER